MKIPKRKIIYLKGLKWKTLNYVVVHQIKNTNKKTLHYDKQEHLNLSSAPQDRVSMHVCTHGVCICMHVCNVSIAPRAFPTLGKYFIIETNPQPLWEDYYRPHVSILY